MVASILVLGAHLWIFDLNSHLTKEGVHLWAETLFYVTSSLILTGTAIAAAWRFRIFRMGEAAIKIDLDVTSRRSSPTYNALSAVAIVTNTSKVVTRFTEVQWEVRVLSPYTDAAVADKVKEYKDYYSVSKDPVEFPWNVNYALSQQDARACGHSNPPRVISPCARGPFLPGLRTRRKTATSPPSIRFALCYGCLHYQQALPVVRIETGTAMHRVGVGLVGGTNNAH